ncbi:hypothetical protein M9Y10_028783 [Tritrichomonas musculus]|uniref:Tubby C-terminal domain-containing protein n=1 Tax=Tritrichomonas musculus TaxID=1915356 RepID=A0ABR2KKA9_9EUKA
MRGGMNARRNPVSPRGNMPSNASSPRSRVNINVPSGSDDYSYDENYSGYSESYNYSEKKNVKSSVSTPINKNVPQPPSKISPTPNSIRRPTPQRGRRPLQKPRTPPPRTNTEELQNSKNNPKDKSEDEQSNSYYSYNEEYSDAVQQSPKPIIRNNRSTGNINTPKNNISVSNSAAPISPTVNRHHNHNIQSPDVNNNSNYDDNNNNNNFNNKIDDNNIDSNKVDANVIDSNKIDSNIQRNVQSDIQNNRASAPNFYNNPNENQTGIDKIRNVNSVTNQVSSPSFPRISGSPSNANSPDSYLDQSYQITYEKALSLWRRAVQMTKNDVIVFRSQPSHNKKYGRVQIVCNQNPVSFDSPYFQGMVVRHQNGSRFTVFGKPNGAQDPPQLAGISFIDLSGDDSRIRYFRLAIPEEGNIYNTQNKENDLSRLASIGNPVPGVRIWSSSLPKKHENGKLTLDMGPYQVKRSLKNFVIRDTDESILFLIFKTVNGICKIKTRKPITPIVAFGLGVAIMTSMK